MIRRQTRRLQALFLLADLLATWRALVAAYLIRFESVWPTPKGPQPFDDYAILLPVIALLWPVVFYFHRLYQLRRDRSTIDEALASSSASRSARSSSSASSPSGAASPSTGRSSSSSSSSTSSSSRPSASGSASTSRRSGRGDRRSARPHRGRRPRGTRAGRQAAGPPGDRRQADRLRGRRPGQARPRTTGVSRSSGRRARYATSWSGTRSTRSSSRCRSRRTRRCSDPQGGRRTR